ncbi:hypothetical protein VPHK566_0268 [Vibrio phage K566]
MIYFILSTIGIVYLANALLFPILSLLELLYNFSFMKNSERIRDTHLKYQNVKYGWIEDGLYTHDDAWFTAIVFDMLIIGIMTPIFMMIVLNIPWIVLAIATPFVLRFITKLRKRK